MLGYVLGQRVPLTSFFSTLLYVDVTRSHCPPTIVLNDAVGAKSYVTEIKKIQRNKNLI